MREGAEVKLVEWVSWERIEVALAWSLSKVMVDMALETDRGGGRKR